MIVEYIRYKVALERADEFARAYDTAATSLRASTACLGYEMARCEEAPDHFILRIEWASTEAHLAGFRASLEFKSFFAAVQPYLHDIEEMRHYQPTALRWTRA